MVAAALKLTAFWSSSGTLSALLDRILDRTPSCQRWRRAQETSEHR
jgi:hypothetical protein